MFRRSRSVTGNAAAELAAAKPAREPTTSVAAAARGYAADDRTASLKKFVELRESGALTAEEFAAEKAKLLGSSI